MQDKLQLFLVLICAGLMQTGCDATNNASILQNDLANSQWILDKAETDAGDITAAPDASSRGSIAFGDRISDNEYRVTGNNGCNGFSGFYQVGGESAITFTKMARSKRACRPEEARVEYAVNRGLDYAESFSVAGTILVIEAPSQQVRLRFIRSINE